MADDADLLAALETGHCLFVGVWGWVCVWGVGVCGCLCGWVCVLDLAESLIQRFVTLI